MLKLFIMKKIYLFITLFATGYSFGQSNYLVENFNYPADALLNANGWFAHSAATTNPISVNNGGLSWATTTYIGSGVGNAALVDNTGSDENKPLDGYLSSGNVYASFLLRVNTEVTTSNDDFFFHFIKYSNETNPVFTAVNTAFRARTYVVPGTTATQFKLGLTFNSATPPTVEVTSDLNLGQTYLVVVKYTFVDGVDNDTVSLYVFSDGQAITTEPSTPSIGPLTGTAADIGIIQGIALRQYAATQNQVVDGIYVRTVWDLTNPGNPLSVDSFADNNSLKIYPNPVNNDFVTIESSLGGDKEVTLFDMNGRMLLQKTMTSDQLDVSEINKGIYLLQTKIGTYTSTTKLVLN